MAYRGDTDECAHRLPERTCNEFLSVQARLSTETELGERKPQVEHHGEDDVVHRLWKEPLEDRNLR